MSVSTFASSVIDRAARHALNITALQVIQLERYYELLRKWNRRTNLTALPLEAQPGDGTIDRLFLESLVAAGFIEDAPTKCFDLGSGGGSPGIPLKIFRERLMLTMVEGRARKAAFLREAVRALGFEDVTILTERAEKLPLVFQQVADIVTIRAVRIDHELLISVRRLLKPKGVLLTFGSPQVPAGFDLLHRASLFSTESFLNVLQLQP